MLRRSEQVGRVIWVGAKFYGNAYSVGDSRNSGGESYGVKPNVWGKCLFSKEIVLASGGKTRELEQNIRKKIREIRIQCDISGTKNLRCFRQIRRDSCKMFIWKRCF